jgi:RNA polymerase sigma-70 factor, ECF subfamily
VEGEEHISGEMDITQFEMIFKRYFNPLCAYAIKYTRDLDTAKEIVHKVYVNIWEKRESVKPDQNIRSYLFTSVYNRCLNHIRDSKKTVDINQMKEQDGSVGFSGDLEIMELQASIEAGIQSLPDRCREIFILSRYDQLKYLAIAEKLNISVKTVEAQMSKALKLLKIYLTEFLSIILIIFLK